MLTKKIKAFSLPELLIVMVLSGLVTGAIYFSYYSVNRYHQNLTMNIDRFGDQQELFFRLKKDMDQCFAVTAFDQRRIDFLTATGIIQYRFLPDRVERNWYGQLDEFRVALTPEFYFRTNTVSEKNQLLDGLKLKFKPNQALDEFIFYKRYDVASVIRFENKVSANE